MDPFAAIGLAGNIITFVDFGIGLISTAKNIYKSKSGTSVDNEYLSSMTQRLRQLTDELKGAGSVGSSSQQNSRLRGVAIECEGVSVELATLLDKLKTNNPRSKRHALKAAARNWWKSDQKSELEKRLDRCKQQLGLELLSSMNADLQRKLIQVNKCGQASNNELQSLARNVESLRQGGNVSFLTTAALNQIRSLVQLSDEAISKVRQSRVLDALRFQSMNERFEDIEKAHAKTFDWIFEDSVDDRPGTDDSIDWEFTGDDIRNSVDYDTNSILKSQSSLEVEPSTGEESSDDSSFVWDIHNAVSIAESEISMEITHRYLPNLPHSSLAISRAEEIPGSTWQVMAKARDTFTTWLKDGTGVFHILDKPGSGKSTLMKYLVQHRKTQDHLGNWANGKRLVLGKFFFWKPGYNLQKNINGLIQGLLHCLLSECPELIQFVFPEQWETSMQRESLHIEHLESRSAFERLIESQTYDQYKFVLFLDGLDEFEGHHADLARQLLKWTHRIQNVKLCISSREWPLFQDIFKDYPRIRLHELTWFDIQRFVGGRLREMDFGVLTSNDGDDDSRSAYETTNLINNIVEGSDGVFLWVSLVLRHIENGIANGDRIQDLIRIVEALPTDLEPMLQQLLDSIPKNNRRLAYSMLSLAQFTIRHKKHVCLIQYSLLEEYLEDQNFAIDWPVRPATTSERKERLKRAERRIYGLCKGLLELREPYAHTTYPNMLGGSVRFIHRSITEFLESQYFKRIVDIELPRFDPFDALCQTYLGQLKLIRLPTSYYSPKVSFTERYPLWNWFMDEFSRYPYHPTFRNDILWLIRQQIDLGRHWAFSEFSQLLSRIHRTVISLETRECAIRFNLLAPRIISCAPGDLVFIFCTILEAFESFPLEENPDSKLKALCVSSCLFSFGQNNLSKKSLTPDTFRILQTLFHRDASPDSKLGTTSGPEFHELLAVCCITGCGRRVSLAIIALMLYYGANPRFALVTSKTIYKKSIDQRLSYVKVYFKSESPALPPGNEVETTRLATAEQYILVASPLTVEIIENHGHTINLRALVSIWFPDQAHVLQQVIDYILELGALTQEHHRRELQTRFGPLLRPLFDEDHPEYVASVCGKLNWPVLDKPAHDLHWRADWELVPVGRL
ncbi:uncharacterized protein F4812DRAFT_170803 [Daldinia caldariorum]|uniref:uncharacterized protein n=1 Tax=Daldinia caldariorum TaxID=326644 RepID=UPI0020072A2E|nr:uncharacterized protein F4812DRAFT_170803 [Daldinia caldariorum]KAI1471225.1 hypothetical protein F4812DRAFT_170803 [Daldinia caldariorum]